MHCIERLESRIAPAVIAPTVATFTDLDGDVVKITSSKPVLAMSGVLTFTSTDGGAHEVLQLVKLGVEAVGAKLTITSTVPAGGMGDGFVNVGAIDAAGVNLGLVTVDGDLGQIDAGHQDALVPALSGLTVHSLGRMGLVTQGGSGGLVSAIAGNVGAVKITTDVLKASIKVTGSIASVTIGGSLIGGTADDSGEISATGPIGAVKIGGDIRGGDGLNSGRVGTTDRLSATVSVGGSVIGGGGQHSGEIFSDRRMGPVTIRGDIRGGTEKLTGRVESGANITSITVGGSLIGSGHDDTGEIMGGNQNKTPTVRIGGDIRGGDATGTASVKNSGFITGGQVGSVFVGGSIIAGVNNSTGTLRKSGAIATNDDLGSVRVMGSLVGNTSVATAKRTYALISGEDVDDNLHTADPRTDYGIGSVFIGGRVEEARIMAGFDPEGVADDADAKIRSVTILGDFIASDIIAGIASTNADFGDTDFSDAVISNPGHVGFPTNFSRIGSIIIGGQVLGTSAAGDSFGIEAQQIGTMKIGGVLLPKVVGLKNFTLAAATAYDVRVREFAI